MLSDTARLLAGRVDTIKPGQPISSCSFLLHPLRIAPVFDLNCKSCTYRFARYSAFSCGMRSTSLIRIVIRRLNASRNVLVRFFNVKWTNNDDLATDPTRELPTRTHDDLPLPTIDRADCHPLWSLVHVKLAISVPPSLLAAFRLSITIRFYARRPRARTVPDLPTGIAYHRPSGDTLED